MVGSILFVEKALKIDDPVGAISVHGVCGAFGTLCVGLFATGEYGGGLNGVAEPPIGLLHGGGFGQLLAQVVGVVANVAWTLPASLLAFAVIGKLVGNRVSARAEVEGLDVPEMGVLGYVPEETYAVQTASQDYLATFGPGAGGWTAAAWRARRSAGPNWRDASAPDTWRAMDATPLIVIPADESTRRLLMRLWRDHVRHHRVRLVLVLVLTALVAGLTAIYPVVIDRAFSMFVARDKRILYQIPAVVIIITATKAAVQYGQSVLVQQLVLLVVRELQTRMFGHLAQADLTRVEREAPAQLAARFTTDAAAIREALTRTVNAVKDGVTIIGLAASMLYLDWVLSLIAAALYPLAAVPIQRLGKRIRRASGGMQEQMGQTAAILTESFVQARTVRAYGLEAVESARATRAFEELYRSLLRMARNRARLDPFLEVLGARRWRR